MATCAGCDAELPPNKAPGRARKWCSERCRKQTLYSVPCEQCGAPTTGDAAYHRLCKACSGVVNGEIMRERFRYHRMAVESAWAAGLTARQMGEQFGWSAPNVQIAQMRARGYDLPHRRSPEAVANIKAGWARVLEARRNGVHEG